MKISDELAYIECNGQSIMPKLNASQVVISRKVTIENGKNALRLVF